MEKEIISTNKAPTAVGPYSQCVKAGGFVFASGQIPLDPITGKLVGENTSAQTRQVLENLKSVLEAAGSSLDKAVKVSVYLKDMDDFGEMNQVYQNYFTSKFPARCCVQIARLPKEARVEIDAIALCE